MNLFRSFAIFLAFVPGLALAGVVVVPADVSVDMIAEPSVGLVPGQPIAFTVSVTNHGPAPVNVLAMTSSNITNELYLSNAVSDCQGLGLVIVDLEFSFYYSYVWGLTDGGVLEIGETRSCHITVPLSVNAPPVWEFGFSIPDFFVDLNPSNNSASVTLRRAATDPTPIPALSSRALILLALLMAAIGAQTAGSTVRGSARSR